MSGPTARTSTRTEPPDVRNRAVDLVRVVALAGVVLGHWLKQGWYVDGAGELHRSGLLAVAPWTHPLTWLFQVMPLFFLVGGFANATSYRHARERGESYATWLAHRTGRLTTPLLPLLALWVVAEPVASQAGREDWAAAASRTAMTPLWFLATYVVVVALVPLTLGAWERWGAATLLVGVVPPLLDWLSLSRDEPRMAALNALLVWGLLHQVGYAWRDRLHPSRRVLLLVAGAALSVDVLLVSVGPFAVSMVGVEGYGVSNTVPPRTPLLLLGVAAACLVLSCEPTLRRVAERPRVWSAVVLLERRVMTIYLWHPTALGLAGLVALLAGGTGLHALPASGEWWAQRPAWLLVLLATTTALVLLVGRWEEPRPVPAYEVPVAVPLTEVAVLVAGVAVLARLGLVEAPGWPDPWTVATLLLVALAALDRVLRPGLHRTTVDTPRPST